jgi:hypothetical protein
MGAILCLLTLVLMLVCVKTGNWSSVSSVLIVWLFFMPVVLTGMTYRISWTTGSIRQKAMGTSTQTIRISRITSVRSETSEFLSMYRALRPMRRISIYEGKKCIDVSLKHFRKDDIQDLLDEIYRQRPDLSNTNERAKID